MAKICGIQQVGIGYKDIYESWKWYRKYFGMNVPVFEDSAEATLMQQYTGAKPQKRHAILALNMQGGGGFELWQFANRTPKEKLSPIKIGDFGILSVKIKTKDINETFEYYKSEGLNLKSEITIAPGGEKHFYLEDPYHNLFELIEFPSFFSVNKNLTGGVCGVTIGVSAMEKSLSVYQSVLGYTNKCYDVTKTFDDLKGLNGGDGELRRVLLKHDDVKTGGFSQLYGSTQIELIERKDGLGCKIYEDRYWGDTGFIHVCFDVIGMPDLKKLCTQHHHPFTVDSDNSFDMGNAAGHFSYIEDPDGTLIEFVETHKVPILKKLGLYLNLKKRHPDKNLPRWMIKLLGLTAIKD